MDAVLALADLSEEQWGLVTTAQARSCGVSAQTIARLAGRGMLEPVRRGVHRVAGVPPDPLLDLRAAWLTLDPARTAAERLGAAAPAVVSHRSAAVLRGLGDVAADIHEFTLPGRKQSRHADVRIHRGALERADWSLVHGLPATTPLRTIADLAVSRLDGGHLGGVLRDALESGQVDAAAVADRLRPVAHHYGAPLGDGDGLVRRLVGTGPGRATPAGGWDAAGLARFLASPEAERLLSAVRAVDPAALEDAARVSRTLTPARLRELARLAEEARRQAGWT